jgi:hypothetical protein
MKRAARKVFRIPFPLIIVNGFVILIGLICLPPYAVSPLQAAQHQYLQ